MRFTLRPGSDPVAIADRTMLAALGMPQGGALKVGETHVRVSPGQVPDPTSLLIGPTSLANTGANIGTSVEVTRSVLPPASIVVVDALELPAGSSKLASALHSTPASPGDLLSIEPGYLGQDDEIVTVLRIAQVIPGPSGFIGASTVFTTMERYEAQSDPRPQPDDSDKRARFEPTPLPDTAVVPRLTRTEALLAGLDNELDLLTGWLKLFAGKENLAETWGLPNVAGVILEAPLGCGGLEVVQEATKRTGAHLHVVSLDLVFKPNRLLDLFEERVEIHDALSRVLDLRVERLELFECRALLRHRLGSFEF